MNHVARLEAVGDKLDALRVRHPSTPPEWASALFLVSGVITRLSELGVDHEGLDNSFAAMVDRLIDGGPPV
jgi:hypothetical protein